MTSRVRRSFRWTSEGRRRTLIQLPLHISPPSAAGIAYRPEDADAPAPAPPLSAATILCVDDEPDVVAVLDWFLTREGFGVITASSGAEALLRVQQRLPDFIITDLSMPGMSGLELCRHLRVRHETSRIPIILYTALSLPAVSWLYDRTFIKPTDLDVFVRAIRALLARPH